MLRIKPTEGRHARPLVRKGKEAQWSGSLLSATNEIRELLLSYMVILTLKDAGFLLIHEKKHFLSLSALLQA